MIVKATQFPGRVATFTRRKNWPFSGGKGHAIQEVEFVIKNRRHRFFFFFFLHAMPVIVAFSYREIHVMFVLNAVEVLVIALNVLQ